MSDTTPSRMTGPLWGIFWMVCTGLSFVGVTAFVKLTGNRIPAVESSFIRFVFGTLFFLPTLPHILKAGYSAQLWTRFGIRGAFHTVGVACWFYAMTQIPIADVTAMNFLNPIYVTIGAALFFGEKIAWRRMLAIAVAFAGMLVILRPGFRELNTGHLSMIFAALCFGGSYLMAKLVSGAGAGVTVAMMSFTVTLGLAPLAAWHWVTPTWTELGYLAVVAVFATAGHYTMTLAFRAAPLTVTQPVVFLQLVWAVSVGALFFAEPVDIFVILGGLIIVSSITFMTWREAQMKKRTTPAAAQTKA